MNKKIKTVVTIALLVCVIGGAFCLPSFAYLSNDGGIEIDDGLGQIDCYGWSFNSGEAVPRVNYDAVFTYVPFYEKTDFVFPNLDLTNISDINGDRVDERVVLRIETSENENFGDSGKLDILFYVWYGGWNQSPVNGDNGGWLLVDYITADIYMDYVAFLGWGVNRYGDGLDIYLKVDGEFMALPLIDGLQLDSLYLQQMEYRDIYIMGCAWDQYVHGFGLEFAFNTLLERVKNSPDYNDWLEMLKPDVDHSFDLYFPDFVYEAGGGIGTGTSNNNWDIEYYYFDTYVGFPGLRVDGTGVVYYTLSIDRRDYYDYELHEYSSITTISIFVKEAPSETKITYTYETSKLNEEIEGIQLVRDGKIYYFDQYVDNMYLGGSWEQRYCLEMTFACNGLSDCLQEIYFYAPARNHGYPLPDVTDQDLIDELNKIVNGEFMEGVEIGTLYTGGIKSVVATITSNAGWVVGLMVVVVEVAFVAYLFFGRR